MAVNPLKEILDRYRQGGVSWSHAPLLAMLAALSITVALIVFTLLSWPHYGVQFRGNAEPIATVTRVAEGGPADLAGLRVGDVVAALRSADGARLPLDGFEAITGRETLASYEDAARAIVNKTRAWDVLQSGPVTFELSTGEAITVEPAPTRPLSSIPFETYFLIVQTLIMGLIVAGILSFAPKTIPVVVLMLSSGAMSVNNLFSALSYGAEFTLPGHLWAYYDVIVRTAVLFFAYGLLALVWYFPRPLFRFPFGAVVLAYLGFVVAAQSLQFFSHPIHPYHGPNIIAMAIGVPACALSWWRTRHDPVQHASVLWFVLSVVIVCLFMFTLFSLPIALGHDPLVPTIWAQSSATLIYMGLALGTIRYRLFDIHRIWWRTMTWILGGLLVIAGDILLVIFFDFDQVAALPLALLIAGWLYFPLRQFIFEYFIKAQESEAKDHLPHLIREFSGVDDGELFDGKFAKVLREIFHTEDIRRGEATGETKTHLDDFGLTLRVPSLSGGGSIELTGKALGRRLFSTQDVRLAEGLLELARYMSAANQREYEKLQAERARIMRDLHDDVGGRLLNIVYTAPDRETGETARETLAALRDTLILIEDDQMVDVSVAWDRFISDARERLEGLGFSISNEEAIASDRTLSAREFINLKRVFQEITNNIIKYGQPGRVTARIDLTKSGLVQIAVSNQLNEVADRQFSSKRGLTNIKTRLEELGGTCESRLEADAIFAIKLELPFSE